MYRKWRGDICQYLGKTGAAPTGYRLPTSNELGLVDAEFSWSATAVSSDGWKWGGSSFPSSPTNNAGYSNGRADLLSGVLSASYNSSLNSNAVGAVLGDGMNTAMGNVIFPAAGLRAGSNGMLSNVGNYGLYWSGSAIGDSYGLGMTFRDTYLDPSVQYNRSSAFSVRYIED
jgi:hypothetical protein